VRGGLLDDPPVDLLAVLLGEGVGAVIGPCGDEGGQKGGGGAKDKIEVEKK